MKYPHLLMTCAAELWALQPEKLEAVSQFLLSKAGGAVFSEAEIEARIGPPRPSTQQPADTPGAIAVLPVYGTLAQRMNIILNVSGGTSMQMLADDFRAAVAEPAIKAIILDINSPGGTVAGTAELGQEIYDSRGVKPIVAQVNSLAASAAYWIACQADEIVVTPSGQAGSIGVFALHENIAKMLANEGIDTTLIWAGKHKVEANPYGPLGEEAHAAIQARIDQSYSAFVGAVARGRGISRGTVNDRFGQGRMYGAAELVARGMADRVATLPQTLAQFGADPHPVATVAAARQSARALADLRQGVRALGQHLKVR